MGFTSRDLIVLSFLCRHIFTYVEISVYLVVETYGIFQLVGNIRTVIYELQSSNHIHFNTLPVFKSIKYKSPSIKFRSYKSFENCPIKNFDPANPPKIIRYDFLRKIIPFTFFSEKIVFLNFFQKNCFPKNFLR